MGSDARSVGEGGGGCGDCILQTCYQTTESWHEHLSDTFCRVRILVRIMTTRNLFRVPHSRLPRFSPTRILHCVRASTGIWRKPFTWRKLANKSDSEA